MASHAAQRHFALYLRSSKGLSRVRSKASAPTMTLHFKISKTGSIYFPSNASKYCRSSLSSSSPIARQSQREATIPVKLPP